MLTPDPFTFARAAEADAALLNLFRQWVQAERKADEYGWENPNNECGLNALADASIDLVRRISELRAGGAIGLAIKAYLFAWLKADSDSVEPAGISGLQDDDDYVRSRILISLVRDLPLFLPEIAPLIRNVTSSAS